MERVRMIIIDCYIQTAIQDIIIGRVVFKVKIDQTIQLTRKGLGYGFLVGHRD